MSRSVERARALLALLDAEDVDGAEAQAEVLWATDREAFWWLLDEQVARGRHSLLVGVVLTRALRALPRPDLEALGRVFRLAVQRLVPEEPCAASQELLACAELLQAGIGEAEPPAWLHLGLASAQVHTLNWLASSGEEQDLRGGLRRITELFEGLSGRELSARDHLQFSTTLAYYAGLTGDGRWLPAARRSLREAEERYPDVARQWALVVLIKFAFATEDASLWREVVEGGEALLQAPEPAELEALVRHNRRREVAHYNLAIAFGALGDRVVGLSHLAESVALNRRRMHMAMTDNDMGPLLSGAGSSAYILFLPPEES